MLTPNTPDAKLDQILKLAIMAVGGQGGGVLTTWIESLARSQGYACQATSVAGVAQRTGATIYYVEMAPASDKSPVFSLAPVEGDLDIVIAAEMMEVGRAIMRGFVTPDKTVLIGSTHRALAVSEKMVPGDGMANADDVRSAAEIAAARLILADMDRLATEQGSVISSSLFGALAGAGVLPFSRDAFEDAIRAGGKGVDASLRSFAAGFDAANGEGVEARTQVSPGVPTITGPEAWVSLLPGRTVRPRVPTITGPEALMAKWHGLQDRVLAFPNPVQAMTWAGLGKVVDFQDCAYGALYLDRLDVILAKDEARQGWELTQTAAKYIANAMAYDDIIRVADLKTRAPRTRRIREEMQVETGKLLEVTEFFHPRAEEIVGLMPAPMGSVWEASPKRMALLSRLFDKGRRVRTDRLHVFFVLHVLGGLKRYRLWTYRHKIEVAHLETWLAQCVSARDTDYALAVELLKHRRLVKGYSDTHARGLSKFSRVMSAAALVKGRDDAAVWMERLREAALQDETGVALDGAIATVESLV